MTVIGDRIDELAMFTKHIVGTTAKPDGWCGAGGRALSAVGGMVASSGNRDYVEIGTLWGATAIMAAMTKALLGLDGMVYCVDPMEYVTQEPCVRSSKEYTPGKISEQMAADMEGNFWDNVTAAGVKPKVKLFKKRSYPWPKELEKKRFGCALIDGWHYGAGPSRDVESLRERTELWIALDDISESYPVVMRAFVKLCNDPRWFLNSKEDRTAIFRRRIDAPVLRGK